MKDFFHEQSFTSTNSVPLQSFVSSQGPTSDQSWNSWCLGLTDAARCVLVVQEWTKYTPPKNSVAKALKRVEQTTSSWLFQKGKGCLFLGGYVSFWGCNKTWHVFGPHHSNQWKFLWPNPSNGGYGIPFLQKSYPKWWLLKKQRSFL